MKRPVAISLVAVEWLALSACQNHSRAIPGSSELCEDCGDGYSNPPPCTWGPCCDENMRPKPRTVQCAEGIDYRCTGGSCGDDLERQTWVRYCDGQQSDCDGELVSSPWAVASDCTGVETCTLDGGDDVPACVACANGCNQDGFCRECSSGQCCDDTGRLKPAEVKCEESFDYRCTGTACGDDLERQSWVRYCDGESGTCGGEPVNVPWTVVEDCTSDQICTLEGGEGVPACVACANGCNQDGFCRDCASGPCCDDTGRLKLRGVMCGESFEHRCSDQECGAHPQSRTTVQFCSGDAPHCGGDEQRGEWEDIAEPCNANELCLTDNASYASCTSCGEYRTCEQGACVCLYEMCSQTCCGPDEVCRYNDSCGQGQVRLVSDEPSEQYRFGSAVSLSGRVAFVGAQNFPTDGVSRSGAVFVFELIDGAWKQVATLSAPQGQIAADDGFGCSVSLAGSRAVVGAVGVDLDDATQNVGAAHIYEHTALGWQHKVELVPASRAHGDSFGGEVLLSSDGTRAVIAATGKILDESAQVLGTVYVFDWVDGAWTQTAELTPPTAPPPVAGFGASISASDDEILISNPFVAIDGKEDVGVVYVFERVAAQWTHTQTWTSDTNVEGQKFGFSVSMDGDWAFVGAWGYDQNQERPYPYNTCEGKVDIFQRKNGQWPSKPSAALMALDENEDARFGASVAVRGEMAAIGAPFFWVGDPYENYRYGAAYAFEHGPGGWQQIARITPPGKTVENYPFDLLFGSYVSLSGDTMLVGTFGYFAPGMAFIQ